MGRTITFRRFYSRKKNRPKGEITYHIVSRIHKSVRDLTEIIRMGMPVFWIVHENLVSIRRVEIQYQKTDDE